MRHADLISALNSARFQLLFAIVMLVFALALPAGAQIIYTETNASIPVGGSYNLDLNGDGRIDFVIKSKLLQGLCQWGDEYVWSLTVIPDDGNDVVTSLDQIGSSYASALRYDVPVGSDQNFLPGAAVMAELSWGACGMGTQGEWLGLPNRYLGLRFQSSDGTTHYAWVKLSTVAYVDRNGHLLASTILLGFAYQASPGEGIPAGAIQ